MPLLSASTPILWPMINTDTPSEVAEALKPHRQIADRLSCEAYHPPEVGLIITVMAATRATSIKQLRNASYLHTTILTSIIPHSNIILRKKVITTTELKTTEDDDHHHRDDQDEEGDTHGSNS